jgi:hypothetical protein
MKDLRSRVAYLRGLSAGLELDTASREGRMISEMLSVVGDIAESLTVLAAEQEDLETYVDVLDTDLQDIEDELFLDDDEDEDDTVDEAQEYTVREWVVNDVDQCDLHGEPLGSGSQIADSYVCPTCGEHVPVREDEAAAVGGATQGSIVLRLYCPGCGTTFCSTEPGTITYIDAEDELTDLAYPTKE